MTVGIIDGPTLGDLVGSNDGDFEGRKVEGTMLGTTVGQELGPTEG